MKPIAYNARQRMDGRKLLSRLPAACAKLVVFDPQYRAGLDKMGYGNEGERQIGRAALRQMPDKEIAAFVAGIERVLRPSGHVALWVDKFTIATAHWQHWMPNFSADHGWRERQLSGALQCVDLITWDKCRIGMGYRSRTQTEFCLILQKKPVRAKGVWTEHGIPDNWPEHSDRSGHAHAKPLQFHSALIKAVTKRGDLVVDPAAGSYVVMEAAHRSGRQFAGCDVV